MEPQTIGAGHQLSKPLPGFSPAELKDQKSRSGRSGRRFRGVDEVRVPELQRWVKPCANLALDVSTVLVTVTADDPKNRRSASGALSSRFLLSLFALDAFSWGTGKLFQYEVVILVEEMGWCYMLAALMLTTSEVVIEFIASWATPYIYRWTQGGDRVTSKNLVLFALRVYLVSNLVALLIYPLFFVVVHVFEHLDATVVVLLGVVRTLQYAFLNQVGDAAVEMAKPHWLATFQGSSLAFPGCCGGRCRWALRRKVTERSLAFYLTLARYLTLSPLAIVYVFVRKNVVMRWGFACALAVWNVVCPMLLLARKGQLTLAIVEQVVDEDPKDAIKGLSSLRGCELSYLLFIVIIKGVPPQSSEALSAALVLSLPSIVQSGLLVIAGVALVAVLLWNIHIRPDADGEKLDDSAQRRQPMFKTGWLAPAWLITLCLSVGALCIFFGGTVGIYFALAVWVPLLPLQQIINSQVDRFLFLYDAQRNISLVYWQNVCQVLVNGPLLALNWITLEQAQCNNEGNENVKGAALLVQVAACILCVLCLYYTCVDAWLPEKLSLSTVVSSCFIHTDATASTGSVSAPPRLDADGHAGENSADVDSIRLQSAA